jgi:hypothetical protein
MKKSEKIEEAEEKEPAAEEKTETASQEKKERYTGHGYAMGNKHIGRKKPY